MANTPNRRARVATHPDFPMQFGRYTLTGLLGKGGMGELYQARLEGVAGWEKSVAIKKILPHLSGEEEFHVRFIDEAKIAVTLSHGNIVSVFDLGEVDGDLYIAMELIRGWDLRQVIRHARAKGIRVPDRLAAYMVAEVCKGLQYAHHRTAEDGTELKVVHRDVSPSNVLVSTDGEVKLTDFGIAKAIAKLGTTVTGQLKGKFNYMSPEQALGQDVDARGDVFAAGIVLFELLTGERPFDGTSDIDTLTRVQTGDRPTIDELRPELEATWVDVVERALEHDRDKRYTEASDLQVALMTLLFQGGGPVTGEELAKYLRGAGIPRVGGSPKSGPGLDTLLSRELDGLINEEGSAPTASFSAPPVARVPTPTPSRDDTVTQTPSIQSVSPAQHRGMEATHQTATIPGDDQHPLLANRAELHVPESVPTTPNLSPVELSSATTVPRKRARRGPYAVAGLLVLVAASFLVWWFARPAMIAVNTQPAGATVYVDGVVHAAVTPTTVRTRPGSHEVRVELDAYEPVSWSDVHAHRGTVFEVNGALNEVTPLPVDVPEAVAPILVNLVVSPLNALVGIDGGTMMPAGQRFVPPDRAVDIRVEAPGYAALDDTRTFSSESGAFANVYFTLTPIAAPVGTGLVADGTGAEPSEIDAGNNDNRERDTGRDRDRDGHDRDEREHASGQDSVAGEGTGDSVPEVDENETGTVTLHFPVRPYWAEVTIDGRAMGRSDAQRSYTLPEGLHTINVSNAGEQTTGSATVTVVAGERHRVTIAWD